MTPPSEAANSGNKVTARRWSQMLEELGHQTVVKEEYNGEFCDLMIALHARRSYDAAQLFRQTFPAQRLIVVLTGTDLYQDLPESREARESLRLADQLVVLQRKALEKLNDEQRSRTHVIYQSASPVLRTRLPHDHSPFQVAVICHLRSAKDPLRIAFAVRQLSDSSRLRIRHAGRALGLEWAEAVQVENETNHRYEWVGELAHDKVRSLIAESHLVVITSLLEGSCNVLSEALSSKTPVICSKIDGLVGTLGEDYPGYFTPQDTDSLYTLLHKVETSPGFYHSLVARCSELRHLILPETEKQALASLLQNQPLRSVSSL